MFLGTDPFSFPFLFLFSARCSTRGRDLSVRLSVCQSVWCMQCVMCAVGCAVASEEELPSLVTPPSLFSFCSSSCRLASSRRLFPLSLLCHSYIHSLYHFIFQFTSVLSIVSIISIILYRLTLIRFVYVCMCAMLRARVRVNAIRCV